jgi:hypothetical protein
MGVLIVWAAPPPKRMCGAAFFYRPPEPFLYWALTTIFKKNLAIIKQKVQKGCIFEYTERAR